MFDILNKLWNGQYSLLVTFWLFGFLIHTTMNAIVIAFEVDYPTIISIFAIFGLAYLVITWVGIWRSATIYQADKVTLRERSLWGYAAKGVVVFGICTNIIQIIIEFKRSGRYVVCLASLICQY